MVSLKHYLTHFVEGFYDIKDKIIKKTWSSGAGAGA